MQVPLFAGGVVHWRCRALVALQPLMVPAPATPPVLNELITAHRVFVERKRAERERAEIEWRLQVAAQIDSERVAAAAHDSHIEWILYEAAIIDWKLLCSSDSDFD